MKYELRYYKMSGVDGSISDKDSIRMIEAKDDKRAIKAREQVFKRLTFGNISKTMVSHSIL